MKTRHKFVYTSAALGLMLLASSVQPAAAKKKTDVGYLVTEVKPTRTGVFVDGKYLGPAANFGWARKYELAPGEHLLLLTEPRCEDYSTTIQIQAGKTLKVERTLADLPKAQPPFAILKTKSDSKFDGVWVNGKFMGHVDEFDNPYQQLLLPPGEYTVRIASPGGETKHEEKVTLTANKVTLVTASKK
jgi:hypothetical protein